MPIINNDEVEAIPFREGYSIQRLAGADHGMACSTNSASSSPEPARHSTFILMWTR